MAILGCATIAFSERYTEYSTFVDRISCCPHADLILPKLSAPHKRLSRFALEGNAYVVCHKCRVSRHAQLCIDAANVVTLLGSVEEFTAKDQIVSTWPVLEADNSCSLYRSTSCYETCGHCCVTTDFPGA